MGKKPISSADRKMSVFYIAVIIFAIFCAGRIGYFALVKKGLYSGSEKYCWDQTDPNYMESHWATDPSYRGIISEKDAPAVRGEIFDDLGRPLRSNYEVYDFTIDGTQLGDRDSLFINDETKISIHPDSEELNLVIDQLAVSLFSHFYSRFGKDEAYYRKKLNLAIKGKKNVLILTSNLNRAEQRINSLDEEFLYTLPIIGSKLNGKNRMRCLNLSKKRGRINPYHGLAERTIGDYIPGRRFGLELEYDSILRGEEGVIKQLHLFDEVSKKDKHGDFVRDEEGDIIKERRSFLIWRELENEPSSGDDIYSTINLEIQNIVHRMLLAKLKLLKAEWGTAVVMETKTGEIKAMVNLGRQDEESQYYKETINYALRNESCEPGSTFKLASLLTYLERTEQDTAKQYYLCGCENQPLKDYFGDRLQCEKKFHEKGNAMKIIQKSANAGTVGLVFENHKSLQEYLDHLDELCITKPFKTQLMDIPTPNFGKDRGSNRFFQTCFGAGFNMAPIRTLTYYNAVANGGKMIAPLFVTAISSQNRIVEEFEAEVISEQICKPSTIEKARKYLEGVVYGEYGMKKRFANHFPKFAGKTGTRDVFVNGHYDVSRNAISFCGYFPADKPEYTCIVYIYDVAWYRGGSYHAAQVFADIATQVWLANHELLREYGQNH